ncbi:MAG TPA: hypothetical protein VGC64_03395 [Pyrinomonadaceae bacterium]|jgi:anti-sigma factor (TIGR02949 family)
MIKFAEQKCAPVRRSIDLYVSDEGEQAKLAWVRRHLESCQPCAAQLAAGRRIKEQLRGAVRRDVVPAGLRERIQLSLRKPCADAAARSQRRPPVLECDKRKLC